MKQNISTTPEQGKRLLACGVDPKSADMIWQEPITTSQKRTGGQILAFRNPNHQDYVGDVPAWSLSRLLDLLPMEIRKDGIDFAMMLKAYPNEEECYRWDLEYYDSELEATAYYSEAPDPIEACVKMVEKLTDNGYKLNEIKQ